MNPAHFSQRLEQALRAKGTPLVVGLDPCVDQFPEALLDRALRQSGPVVGPAQAVAEFCRRVIDRVAPLVPAVKVQSAFFELLGPEGAKALDEVMRHAHEQGLLVIFDGKRGDIGSTAEAYAAAYLGAGDALAESSRKLSHDEPGTRAPSTGEPGTSVPGSKPSDVSHPRGTPAAPWPADAITVNPYLGPDTLEPFVSGACQSGRGIFVLVKTSNPGSGAWQDLVCDGRPVYRHVAEQVAAWANRTRGSHAYGAVGAVVGATYPDQLAELRGVMPHAWFLVPGYGAQGAGAADIAAAFDSQGLGALINSSRAILQAFRREPYTNRFGPARWEDAVEHATRDAIAELASATPANRLRT